MPEAVERSAPGKIILCGEHSVVYGRPAIAVPVSDLRTHARIEPDAQPGLRIVARDLRQTIIVRDAPPLDALAQAARLVLERLGAAEPDAVLTVQSDLPIAAGMGSGAAVTVALARALSAYLGAELPADELSALTYEVEKIHHGTPSGIDNTVIAWEAPIYFVKEQPPETFTIGEPFDMLIANSGIASSTLAVVSNVRQQWLAHPEFYNILFDCVGAIATAARAAIEQGARQALGTLLNENHELLVRMGVSIPQLNALVQSACQAGALGAKLTGSGQGGNVIALVKPDRRAAVTAALQDAGAVKIWHTRIGGPRD